MSTLTSTRVRADSLLRRATLACLSCAEQTGLLCLSCAGGRTIYATVTSDGARLYALFCIGATAATEDVFKMMRASLRTIK